MNNNIENTNATRILYLYEDVGHASVSEITKSIINFIVEDNKQENKIKNYTRKPIRLIINSFGGSVYDMWGLIDIILASPTPIYTYTSGYAMSAAFMIFIAGHKRFILNNSTIMIHQLYSGCSGKYFDLIESVEECTRLHERMTNYIKTRTKIKLGTLKTCYDTKKNWYIDSEMAIDLNIADEIVTSLSDFL